jgi:hypothetical protein
MTAERAASPAPATVAAAAIALPRAPDSTPPTTATATLDSATVPIERASAASNTIARPALPPAVKPQVSAHTTAPESFVSTSKPAHRKAPIPPKAKAIKKRARKK